MVKRRSKKRNGDYPLSIVIAILVIGILVGASAVLYYRPFYAPSVRPSIEREPVQITGTNTVAVNIVAVAGEGGEGVIGRAIVEIRSGEGRVLVSANPFVEPDTQDSIKTARSVAEDILGVSLARSDIIVSFSLGLPANLTQIVGGPSAGSALAVAIIAAVQGKQLRDGVAFTGTVDESGRIGQVGGILEKAEAAGKAGMQLFIVPGGQGNLTFYEKEVLKESKGNFVVQRIKYYPRTVSLSEYTGQWNMTTYEAFTVADAARFSIVGFQPPVQGEDISVAGAVTGAAVAQPYTSPSPSGCDIYG